MILVSATIFAYVSADDNSDPTTVNKLLSDGSTEVTVDKLLYDVTFDKKSDWETYSDDGNLNRKKTFKVTAPQESATK